MQIDHVAILSAMHDPTHERFEAKVAKPKIRRSWGIIKPVTKRIESKKRYNRKDKNWRKGE